MKIGATLFLTDLSIDATELAIALEERGFASLYVPEHTHLPVRAAKPPGLVDGVGFEDYRRSLDPFVVLSAAAAVTKTLRLGTGVLLAAQHDPIGLAKRVATLDHLSGGRTELGIGFGWNRAEAADHGVDFGRRREIVAEYVGVMRALWTMDEAEYHGEFVDLEPCYAYPKPAQGGDVPILIGGAAAPKVFRAVVEYAHGWLPIGATGLSTELPGLRGLWTSAGREGAPRVVPFGTTPTEGKLAHLRAIGIEEVVLRVPTSTRDQVLETLDAFAPYVETFGAA